MIELWSEDGTKAIIRGSSIGGGAVKVESVNGMEVSFSAEYSTLVIPHKDEPGVIAAVTSILAEKRVNIARMKIFHKHRGGVAYIIIETDQPITEETNKLIAETTGVISSSIIKAIQHD